MFLSKDQTFQSTKAKVIDSKNVRIKDLKIQRRKFKKL